MKGEALAAVAGDIGKALIEVSFDEKNRVRLPDSEKPKLEPPEEPLDGDDDEYGDDPDPETERSDEEPPEAETDETPSEEPEQKTADAPKPKQPAKKPAAKTGGRKKK